MAMVSITQSLSHKILADHRSDRTRQFLQDAYILRFETRMLVQSMDFRKLKGMISRDWVLDFFDDDEAWSVQSCRGRLFRAMVLMFPALKFVKIDGLCIAGFGDDRRDGHRTRAKIGTALKSGEACQSHSAKDASSDSVRDSDGSKLSLHGNTSQEAILKEERGLILFSASSNPELRFGHLFPHTYFHTLLYLDLSYLQTIEGIRHFFRNKPMPSLRILKLQNTNLIDDDLSVVLEALNAQLWSLDIRDNYLTNKSLSVLKHSFLPSTPQLRHSMPSLNQDGHPLLDTMIPFWYQKEPPSYTRDVATAEYPETLGSGQKPPFRDDHADAVIAYLQLHHPDFLVAYHASRASDTSNILFQKGGLTHLYLSGNKLTYPALNQLFSNTRSLQLLDIGGTLVPSTLDDDKGILDLPFSWNAAPDLEVLRAHFSCLTTSVAFNPHANPSTRLFTLAGLPRQAEPILVRRLKMLLAQCASLRRICDQGDRVGLVMKSGLHTLRLEFAKNIHGKGRSRSVERRAVSEDASAEIFMQASDKDFSFFDDEPVLLGSPIRVEEDEAAMAEKRATEGLVDVLEALKAYRAETRAAYEHEVQRSGSDEPDLEKTLYHWPGKLEIVT
jgi:hypothetical protein